MSNVFPLHTASPKAICVRCSLCQNNSRKAKPIWYDLRCKAKKVRRTAGVDCVTGQPGWMAENDLGQSYIDETPYPYCRDINTDGACKFFEGSEQ